MPSHHIYAFPPYVAIRGECAVRKDRVCPDRSHRVGVGVFGCAGRDSKKAGLWVYGTHLAIFTDVNPRDVVADSGDFPALEGLGRYEHREIRLAARARKCSGDICLFMLGRLDAQDEHMLREPSLIARDDRCNAQREAFFSEKGVASVAGAIGPDFSGFGKVNNVLRIGIAGPGDILLPMFQRHSDGVHAGHELSGFAQGLDHLSTHSGHDPHILNNVGGVGELYADIRHWRADRAHGKGDDVHGAAAHASFEERLEDIPHLLRIHPVVGGAGICFTPAADEGAVFDAGHVAGIGPREEGVGAFFRIEGDEGARGD